MFNSETVVYSFYGHLSKRPSVHVVILSSVPELMAPPDVSAMSPTSLKVIWSSAEGQGVIARGHVTEYRVNLLTEQTDNPYAPPVVSQVSHYRHVIIGH